VLQIAEQLLNRPQGFSQTEATKLRLRSSDLGFQFRALERGELTKEQLRMEVQRIIR